MREPSAKGRRKAATKEEDEEVSNSSSNGSGIPGPAEKVAFFVPRTTRLHFFHFRWSGNPNGSGVPGPEENFVFFSPSKIHPIFTSIKVFFSPHPNRSTFHPGGSLAANDLKQRALHGQQSEGETAGTAEGHRRRLALQVTFALTPITYYLHTRTYSKWSI